MKKSYEIDLSELAQRIYDLDPYEMRNNDATPESIENEICEDPRATINYLLDIIDELQA